MDLDADADWDDHLFYYQTTYAPKEQRQAAWDAMNKEGDGSAENPFKNLAYALTLAYNASCDNYAADYLQWTARRTYNRAAGCAVWIVLKCTGTAHYRAVPYTYNNYSGWIAGSGNSDTSHIIVDGANIEITQILDLTSADTSPSLNNTNVLLDPLCAAVNCNVQADLTIDVVATFSQVICGIKSTNTQYTFCYNCNCSISMSAA